MIRGGSGRRNSDYSTYDDDNYYDDSGEFIATADSEYDYDQYHDHGDFPGSSGMHSGRHQHRSHDSHRGHHHHRDYVHQQKAYEDMTTVERIAALGTRREKKVVVKESESVKFRHMDHLSESRITHITRWRDKFEEIKDSKDALLLERLENRKKDRVAVFEDPKLLKNAMRLVIEKERSHRKQLYNQSRRRHHLRASQYDDDTDSVASAASSRHSVHSANNTDKLNDSDHFDGDAAADNTAPMNLNLNMRMNKHNTTVQGSNRARHRKDAAMTRSASTPAFLRPSKRNHNTRHNKKQLNSSSIDARRQNWTYTHASIWDRAKTLKKSANGYSSDGAPGEYKYAPSVKFQTGGNGNSSANNSNSSDIHHRSKNSGGSIENNNNNHNNNNNNKGESASDNQDSRHTVMLKSKYHRRKSLHRATSKEVLLREGGFSTKGGRKLNNQSRHRNQRER